MIRLFVTPRDIAAILVPVYVIERSQFFCITVNNKFSFKKDVIRFLIIYGTFPVLLTHSTLEAEMKAMRRVVLAACRASGGYRHP